MCRTSTLDLAGCVCAADAPQVLKLTSSYSWVSPSYSRAAALAAVERQPIVMPFHATANFMK